jgi:hypothetical protein
MDLTPSQKGAIAETAVIAEAARLHVPVYRPAMEGTRADMVFEVGDRLLRVQCKWARVKGEVVYVALGTCRLTPRGYVRTTYSRSEIDGFAAHCAERRETYWLPIEEFEGRTFAHLRLTPAKNNQRASVRMAASYPFGAVAQLEERRHGMAEVRGSSPLSSTSKAA